MDADGFQLVMSRNTKQRLRENQRQWSFHIEAKTFTFKLKDSAHGTLLQLSEHRPLTRTILLPITAICWLRDTLSDCIHFQKISHPLWFQSGNPKLEAFVSTNFRGQFLSLTEILPDGRSFTICIPQGSRRIRLVFFPEQSPFSSSTTDAQSGSYNPKTNREYYISKFLSPASASTLPADQKMGGSTWK